MRTPHPGGKRTHPGSKGALMELRAEGLVKKYGRRVVVNDVDLSVEQGRVVGLLGPNGAGKTTSFYMMVGLVRPNQGRIMLGDKDISNLPIFKRAKLGVGYLAQEPSIFRKLSVENNLRLILENMRLSRKEQNAIIDRLLREFNLQKLRGVQGAVLSGGERRRVEIARSLAASPKFLLLDEPFTGVDPIAVQEIQTIIAELRSRNIGVLITDHSVRDILAVSDKVYIMHQGRILEKGTAAEVANSELAKKYYLGERFQADDTLLSKALDDMASRPADAEVVPQQAAEPSTED